MKKVMYFVFIATIVFLMCACTNKKIEKEEKVDDEEIGEEPISEEEKDTYVDDNPITVGLYINYNGTTTLVDHYDSTWKQYTDIIVFSTFYTKEKTLTADSVAGTFDTYKNNYSNINNYRIGYNVKFSVKNGDVIDRTILNITDSILSTEYLLFYFYDDILHRNDNWYSHITETEWNTSTMMTSFKITGGTVYNEVTSPVEVTVFTYDGTEDFDEDGKYRGNSKYTVILNNI